MTTKMSARRAVVCACLAASSVGLAEASSARAAPLGWTLDHPSSSPSPRYGAAMAYDPHRRLVVLFGGIDASGTFLGDTWTFDGVTWTQRTPPSSPPARSSGRMAWSPANDAVLLCGGASTKSGLSDAWLWNGSSWSTTSGSPACGTISLGDSLEGQHVVGYDDIHRTWGWDGSRWSQLADFASPARPQGQGASATWDPDHSIFLLFGGETSGSYYGATWTWDGSGWTQHAVSSSPSPRANAVMAYDTSARRAVITTGAAPNNDVLSDTWMWDGSAWDRLTGPGPEARASAAGAYDAALGTVVLFGGYRRDGSTLGDTWELALPAAPLQATPTPVPTAPVLPTSHAVANAKAQYTAATSASPRLAGVTSTVPPAGTSTEPAVINGTRGATSSMPPASPGIDVRPAIAVVFATLALFLLARRITRKERDDP